MLLCAGALAGGVALAAAGGERPADGRAPVAAQRQAPAPEVVHATVAAPEAQDVQRIAFEPLDLSREHDPFGRQLADGMPITGATPHRLILFTFDDGPDYIRTPKLLDSLDRAGVRAVFFLTANKLRGENRRERQHQAIARDIVRRGHLIGNHTLDHAQLPTLSDAEVRYQLVEAERVFERVLGERPWLLRPPGGARSERVDAIAAERGYTQMMWNLGTGDFLVRTPAEVLGTWRRVFERRTAEHGDRGGIILLHDTHEWSVEAFPLIVEELRRRNCDLLERDEELYDIVDDPRLFFAPRADAPPHLDASPAIPDPAILEARQERLREETRLRCTALAQSDAPT